MSFLRRYRLDDCSWKETASSKVSINLSFSNLFGDCSRKLPKIIMILNWALLFSRSSLLPFIWAIGGLTIESKRWKSQKVMRNMDYHDTSWQICTNRLEVLSAVIGAMIPSMLSWKPPPFCSKNKLQILSSHKTLKRLKISLQW